MGNGKGARPEIHPEKVTKFPVMAVKFLIGDSRFPNRVSKFPTRVKKLLTLVTKFEIRVSESLTFITKVKNGVLKFPAVTKKPHVVIKKF